MTNKEWDPRTVFDVIGDEEARQILALASLEPMPADDLAERCNTSLPTVYRRVNTLLEYDLLREEVQIDDDGNHYKTFETILDQVCFEVEQGSFNIRIEQERDMVDQFESFWGSLEGESNHDS